MLEVTQTRLNKFCKILEWTLFLGLCIAAIFVANCVWKEYRTFGSNFKKSKAKVSDAPTIGEFQNIIDYMTHISHGLEPRYLEKG